MTLRFLGLAHGLPRGTVPCVSPSHASCVGVRLHRVRGTGPRFRPHIAFPLPSACWGMAFAPLVPVVSTVRLRQFGGGGVTGCGFSGCDWFASVLRLDVRSPGGCGRRARGVASDRSVSQRSTILRSGPRRQYCMAGRRCTRGVSVDNRFFTGARPCGWKRVSSSSIPTYMEVSDASEEGTKEHRVSRACQA